MNADMNLLKHQKILKKNIERLKTQKNLNQNKIKEKCNQAGYTISQSTVSNILNAKGNITLSNLLAIASAFEVDIKELFVDSIYDEEINSLPVQNTEAFICNPDSVFLTGYLGDFHVLFYKTSGSSNDMVTGLLQIKKNNDSSKCIATLKINVDEIDNASGESAIKIYEGELIVSHPMRAVYVQLINNKLGEMAMLVFQHIFTSYRNVETAMAVAITTASGANRRPTVHRMALSRTPIDPERLKYIKGQLLMNTSDVFITDEQIECFCNEEDVPESFKELLRKVKTATKTHCYCIPEGSLYDSTLSEAEQLKYISLLRAASKAAKYNKISKKSDETLYALLGNRNR